MLRPIDLYIITTTKSQSYLLYANIKKYSSLIVLIPRYSILVRKAEAPVIAHSMVCSSIAENTKVPPPGRHRCCQFSLAIIIDRASTGDDAKCQESWVGDGSTKDVEGVSTVLGGFIIQEKRQMSKNVNSL